MNEIDRVRLSLGFWSSALVHMCVDEAARNVEKAVSDCMKRRRCKRWSVFCSSPISPCCVLLFANFFSDLQLVPRNAHVEIRGWKQFCFFSTVSYWLVRCVAEGALFVELSTLRVLVASFCPQFMCTRQEDRIYFFGRTLAGHVCGSVASTRSFLQFRRPRQRFLFDCVGNSVAALRSSLVYFRRLVDFRSRNKVSVGEPAEGSSPIECKSVGET